MTAAAKGEGEVGSAIAASPGYYALVASQFWRRRVNRVALVIMGLIVLVALFADFLAADKPILLSFGGELFILPNLFHYPELQIYDMRLLLDSMQPGDWAINPIVPWGYNTHDLSQVLQGPSELHWLGTDGSGRDVLSRIIHGSRVSLAVGVMAVTLLVGIGMLLGSLAGYFGGLIDGLLMRIVEIVHSLPTILILVVMLAVIAPEGWGAVFAIMGVIGAVGWTSVARLIRGEILRVKTLDYVTTPASSCVTWCRIRSVRCWWLRPLPWPRPSSGRVRSPSSASGFQPTWPPGEGSCRRCAGTPPRGGSRFSRGSRCSSP
jgi:ABC-type dipeptide/oligopeptide/nickel transport system permease subunit